MLVSRGAEQLEFFAASLRDLIADEHVLARVARVLDLSWLRAEVAELYCADNGRPGIDPEAAVLLMLAGFLLGIVHDRKLMREAHVNFGDGDGHALEKPCKQVTVTGGCCGGGIGADRETQDTHDGGGNDDDQRAERPG